MPFNWKEFFIIGFAGIGAGYVGAVPLAEPEGKHEAQDIERTEDYDRLKDENERSWKQKIWAWLKKVSKRKDG